MPILHLRVAWQTHAVTTPETEAGAQQLMIKAWLEVGFLEKAVAQHVVLAAGSAFDRNGAVSL